MKKKKDKFTLPAKTGRKILGKETEEKISFHEMMKKLIQVKPNNKN